MNAYTYKLPKIVLSCLLFVGCWLLAGTQVQAATLQFDPASASGAIGETFDLAINVNTGSDEVLAVDAQMRYDKNILSVESCEDGDFLTVARKDYATQGQIYIPGIVQDPGHPVTGTGKLASCTFKVKANGTTNVTFACTPGETATDSNIAKNNPDATDVIQCSDNGVAVITAGTGVGGAPTATPSGTTTDTSSTPSTLPRTGIMDELMKFAIPGAILLVVGLVGKLLLKF